MRGLGLAVVIMLAMPMGGCERPPAGVEGAATRPAAEFRDRVADPQVVEAEVDVPCPRLLSAAPNVTEICCALGLAECLVGRTRYCTYPPAVQKLPTIGAINDLSVESLLGLSPELVLVSGRSRAISERLRHLGVAFESVPDESLEDLFAGIERIGERVGRPETARRLVAGIRQDLEAVAARFVDVPSSRVLLLIGAMPDPPTQAFAAGPGSFYDDLLRRAGQANVVTGGRSFAPVSLEFVMTANPDVILELVADADARPAGAADARRIWGKVGPLRAVEAGRVHVLIGTEHMILGPRIAETFAAICEAIRDGSRDDE